MGIILSYFKKNKMTICISIIVMFYLILVIFQPFFEAKRVKKDYDDLKIILKKNIVSRYADEYLSDKFI